MRDVGMDVGFVWDVSNHHFSGGKYEYKRKVRVSEPSRFCAGSCS